MSSTADQGGLVVRLHAGKARQARPVQRRAAAAFECDHHTALERALIACLSALAELAAATGDAERPGRLRAALERLEADTVADDMAQAPVKRPGRRTAARRIHPPLSNREGEVAGLIATGLTNREIAEVLVISERTADSHVQNILNKLGLVSRAQVAAWFIAHNSASVDRPRAI